MRYTIIVVLSAIVFFAVISTDATLIKAEKAYVRLDSIEFENKELNNRIDSLLQEVKCLKNKKRWNK